VENSPDNDQYRENKEQRKLHTKFNEIKDRNMGSKDQNKNKEK
jgi:hypothetical protein